MYQRRILQAAAFLAAACFIVGCGVNEGDLEEAVVKVREGHVQEAIETLERVVEKAKDGSELGDRAALILGNLLMQNRRPEEALEPLRKAAAGQVGAPYARMLIARAAVQGELRHIYSEASDHAIYLESNLSGEVSPLLKREALYLLTRLRYLQGDWEEAARYGERFLQHGSGRLEDEARWYTAEALRRGGQAEKAHALHASIWFDTPKSPWALQAREQMLGLETAHGLAARTLPAGKHYDFIKALRSAGLHKNALVELDTYFDRRDFVKPDGALFMKTMSLHAERKNKECVQTAETVWNGHPNSQWRPHAGIYAIKCLRRSDTTPEIRRWAQRIIDRYPRHDKAMEAYYNLGGYLGNVVSKEEAIQVLNKLVQVGGDHPDVRDALWRIAWLERNLGRTNRAITTLELLVREHPASGYRKGALYWQARFHEESGQEDLAKELYKACVVEFPNHYYGHKARENLIRLGGRPEPGGLQEAFPTVDHLTDSTARPGASEEYVRAVKLKALGLYEFAAAELESMRGIDDDLSLQFALADLYSRSGNTWAADAIIRRHFKRFIDSGSRDSKVIPIEFWHIVYPFNHRAEITAALRETGLIDTGIDPYLTASLIRLESRFLPTAISPVGAVGLMQLMPGTVEQIARKRGLGEFTQSDLFNPNTNIRLGTYYLADLIEEFGRDWFPAICSYNAGPGAVKRWWDTRPPGQSEDEFIENIPFTDTRLYIKQVLGDYQNYQWIYPE